jgi:hypothetical protein
VQGYLRTVAATVIITSSLIVTVPTVPTFKHGYYRDRFKLTLLLHIIIIIIFCLFNTVPGLGGYNVSLGVMQNTCVERTEHKQSHRPALPTHPPTHSLTHSPSHRFTHPPIHAFTHLQRPTKVTTSSLAHAPVRQLALVH